MGGVLASRNCPGGLWRALQNIWCSSKFQRPFELFGKVLLQVLGEKVHVAKQEWVPVACLKTSSLLPSHFPFIFLFPSLFTFVHLSLYFFL